MENLNRIESELKTCNDRILVLEKQFIQIKTIVMVVGLIGSLIGLKTYFTFENFSKEINIRREELAKLDSKIATASTNVFALENDISIIKSQINTLRTEAETSFSHYVEGKRNEWASHFYTRNEFPALERFTMDKYNGSDIVRVTGVGLRVWDIRADGWLYALRGSDTYHMWGSIGGKGGPGQPPLK